VIYVVAGEDHHLVRIGQHIRCGPDRTPGSVGSVLDRRLDSFRQGLADRAVGRDDDDDPADAEEPVAAVALAGADEVEEISLEEVEEPDEDDDEDSDL